VANDLERVGAFIEAYGGDAASLVKASVRLSKGLGIVSTAQGKPIPSLFTGIPDADLAIYQAGGVTEIAAEEGVGIDDIIEFTTLLLSVGLAFL